MGAAYQMVGTWHDERRFPQRGRSVQAADVRLNIDCTGQNTPTIVLDTGWGLPAVSWIQVQPEVAKFARVCSYDRAGYGWSDRGPEPRTSSQIARELKALLTAAGEQGPYVLVGHSLGAFNARVFTHLYPGDVAGLVFVDGAHEDEEARINELLPDTIQQQEKKNDERHTRMNQILAPFRIYFGIDRLGVATGWFLPGYASNPHLSNELRQQLLYLKQKYNFRYAPAAEMKVFQESAAEVRASGDIGNRPLIVLTAGIPYDHDPLLTREQMERQNNLWINILQVQEAHLSTRGKQIVVPDSTHLIPYDRPEAVISAIREVWSEVQGN